MTVSGMRGLTPDEIHILDDYRVVRAEGYGFLFVEFSAHKCQKYEVKLGGRHAALNALLLPSTTGS